MPIWYHATRTALTQGIVPGKCSDARYVLGPGGPSYGATAVKGAIHRARQEARRHLQKEQLSSTRRFPVRDGFSSSLKIHKPAKGGGPLIVLAFGGGFLGGDNDQLSEYARALVQLFGATVVNISYRVGPRGEVPSRTARRLGQSDLDRRQCYRRGALNGPFERLSPWWYLPLVVL